MELNDDVVVEIVSYLPHKFAVQCKLLSKKFNSWISDPKFCQSLYQHQKISSTILIYSALQEFHKVFINPMTPNRCEMSLRISASLLASCKGLLLLALFEDIRSYCVFNPLTGKHQLIPFPEPMGNRYRRVDDAGLGVDYPTSDQYKLVIIETLKQKQGYKFQMFSSEGSRGILWREFQLRTKLEDTGSLSVPVYVHDSMHWLRRDGRVIAFDTKREEARILDFPDFINRHDLLCGNINPSFNTWLGIAQGSLTLMCLFNKSTVIAAYDYASCNWRVSHTSSNFIKCLSRYRHKFGFPVWIDSKQPLFLLDRCSKKHIPCFFEYDSGMNRYKMSAVLDKDDRIMLRHLPSFNATLASVPKTFSVRLNTEQSLAINATLAELKRFIIDGTS